MHCYIMFLKFDVDVFTSSFEIISFAGVLLVAINVH